MSDRLTLDLPPELVEAIAERAAELVLEQAPAQSERWVGTRDAADYLGCSPGRLHNLTSAGRIPHHREGGRLVFSTRELDDWIRSGRAAS